MKTPMARNSRLPSDANKLNDPLPICIDPMWCTVHKRKASHIDVHGNVCCDPNLGGIMLPCKVEPLADQHCDKATKR